MVKTKSRNVYKRVTSPLKWHGGKYYLARRLIELAPPRAKNPNNPAADDKGYVHFGEVYFGGGQFLFCSDPNGVSEFANDIDPQLMNFWSVLQCPKHRDMFVDRLRLTPVSADLFAMAKSRLDREVEVTIDNPDVELAVMFFIKYRQSRQALGESFVTLSSSRTRRGRNEQVSSWMGAVDDLEGAIERLARVVLFNEDALTVIRREDSPRTFFYLDPTYLKQTRVSKKAYRYEMSDEEHVALLDTLSGIEGYFMLSGYRSQLYDNAAERFGWRRVDIDISLSSSSKKEKEIRTECVWMNYGKEENK